MERRTFLKALGAAVLLPALPSSEPPLFTDAQVAEARRHVKNHRLDISTYVDPGVYISEVTMPNEFEYDMRPGHMTHERTAFPKLRFYDQFGQELDLPIVAADPKTKRILYITEQKNGMALTVDRNAPEASLPAGHRGYLEHPYTYEMGDGLFIPLVQRQPITVEVAS